jgi:predicted N-acetyltransferase YhbS
VWLTSALQLVFGTKARFSPPAASALPVGLKIRKFLPTDHDACMRIYRDNKPGRFPDGVAPEFEFFLARQDYLKLVCCVGDRLTAVGGIGLIRRFPSTRAWLVFGIVDPSLHGNGIGTALLLARLAALPRPVKPLRLLLSNVHGSVGFFARFGFQLQGQMAVRPGGQRIDVCSAMLDVSAWEICHGAVSQHVEQLSTLEVPQIDFTLRSPNNRSKGRNR